MSTTKKVLMLPGDGIGPEVMDVALEILEATAAKFDFQVSHSNHLVGGAALDGTNNETPLPQDTIAACEKADAILFGSVGGPKWEHLPPDIQPERGALLPLRKHFGLFANLRPGSCHPSLTHASPVKNELIPDGFDVLCYSSDDPIMATRLRDAGATSVMPAGSPIGSGRGISNPASIRIILELLKDPAHGGDPDYPVIVDAGVGTPSDITIAMELGADGVLLNTGIAHAKRPVDMATAMRLACEAGWIGFRAGRIPRRLHATASSPWEGVISHIPGE